MKPASHCRTALRHKLASRDWSFMVRAIYEQEPDFETNRGEPRLLVVVEEAEDVVLFEAVAAAEEVELNGEGEAGDFAA